MTVTHTVEYVLLYQPITMHLVPERCNKNMKQQEQNQNKLKKTEKDVKGNE